MTSSFLRRIRGCGSKFKVGELRIWGMQAKWFRGKLCRRIRAHMLWRTFDIGCIVNDSGRIPCQKRHSPRACEIRWTCTLPDHEKSRTPDKCATEYIPCPGPSLYAQLFLWLREIITRMAMTFVSRNYLEIGYFGKIVAIFVVGRYGNRICRIAWL